MLESTNLFSLMTICGNKPLVNEHNTSIRNVIGKKWSKEKSKKKQELCTLLRETKLKFAFIDADLFNSPIYSKIN